MARSSGASPRRLARARHAGALVLLQALEPLSRRLRRSDASLLGGLPARRWRSGRLVSTAGTAEPATGATASAAAAAAGESLSEQPARELGDSLRSASVGLLARGRAQRRPEIGLPEGIAQLRQAAGHHPHAGGHDRRHLAVEQLHRERRARARSAGRWSTRPSAFDSSLLVTGSGAVTFSGPLRRAVSRAKTHRAHHVVGVDPGHVLAPAGHRAAHAELERAAASSPARRRTPRAPRRCGSVPRAARAPRPCGPRPPTPRTPRPGSRPAAGSDSSTRSSPRGPYQPRGGLGDQHAPGAGLGSSRSAATRLRVREHARVADLALRLVAPALGDGLAQQVHHAVLARERLGRRRLGLAGPSTRAACHAPSRARGARRRARARSPRRRGRRSSSTSAAPDRAGGAGDGDLHGSTSSWQRRGSESSAVSVAARDGAGRAPPPPLRPWPPRGSRRG